MRAQVRDCERLEQRLSGTGRFRKYRCDERLFGGRLVLLPFAHTIRAVPPSLRKSHWRYTGRAANVPNFALPKKKLWTRMDDSC